MSEEEQKKIFARNLNNLLSERGKNQNEVAAAIGVSPQTFNTWCRAIAIPRMGKIQKLADYFGIEKSDLVDNKEARPAAPTTLAAHFEGQEFTQEEIEEIKRYADYIRVRNQSETNK